MTLDKAIAAGKEHRKPYYRSGRFDRTCRNHGSCPYCQGSRQRQHTKRILTAEEKLAEAAELDVLDLDDD